MNFSWSEFLSLPVTERVGFLKICDDNQAFIEKELNKVKLKRN